MHQLYSTLTDHVWKPGQNPVHYRNQAILRSEELKTILSTVKPLEILKGRERSYRFSEVTQWLGKGKIIEFWTLNHHYDRLKHDKQVEIRAIHDNWESVQKSLVNDQNSIAAIISQLTEIKTWIDRQIKYSKELETSNPKPISLLEFDLLQEIGEKVSPYFSWYMKNAQQRIKNSDLRDPVIILKSRITGVSNDISRRIKELKNMKNNLLPYLQPLAPDKFAVGMSNTSLDENSVRKG